MILVPTREQAEVIKAKIDAQCCRRQRCRNEYRAANTESLLITETNGTDIAGATFMNAFSTALTSRSYFDKKIGQEKRLVKPYPDPKHVEGTTIPLAEWQSIFPTWSATPTTTRYRTISIVLYRRRLPITHFLARASPSR